KFCQYNSQATESITGTPKWKRTRSLMKRLQTLRLEHRPAANQDHKLASRLVITATTGLAFAMDLAARGEHAALAVFAAWFVALCAWSSLSAWCVARRNRNRRHDQEQEGGGAWAAAAPVLLWSLAMALVLAMTSWAWASLTAPRPAGPTMGLLVGGLCFAAIVPLRFRVSVTLVVTMGKASRPDDAFLFL
ncbi:hypothetical protein BRADI_5g13416v3, partial [Brachypodium distachyon]